MILDFSQYVFPGAIVSPEWTSPPVPVGPPVRPVDIVLGGTLGPQQNVIGNVFDEQLPPNE